MNRPDGGGGKPRPNSSNKSRPAAELFIDHLIRMEISNQLENGISAEATTVAAIQESTHLPSNENQQRDKLPWSQQCLNYLVQELSSGRKTNRIIKDTCPDSELTDKDLNILENDLTNKKELSVTNRVDDPNEQYKTSLNLFKNDMTPLNLVNDMTPLNLVMREKTHQETNKSVNGKQHLPPANTKDGLPSQTNNLITIEGSAEMSSTFVDQDTQSKDNIVIGDKDLTPQDPANTELAVKKEASFNEMPVVSLESEFPDMTTKETTEKNIDVSPEYEAPLAMSTASLGDEDDPKIVSSVNVTHGSINSTECNDKTDAREAFGSKDTESKTSGENDNKEGKLENKSVRDMTHMNTLIHKAIDQCLIREAVDEFNRMVEAAMSKKEGRGQLLAGNDDIESTSSKSLATADDEDSECNLMKYTKIVEGDNGSVSYICTKCEISFPHMTDLHMHTFTHFRRKHRCPACKKEFYNLSSVKRHMIIHTRLKPFKCPRCARAFNLHTNLRKHFQRMHDAKLPSLSRREVARNTIQFNKGSNVNRILSNWQSRHAIETPRAQLKFVRNINAATRDAASSSNALILLPGHTDSMRMQPNTHAPVSPPVLQDRLPPPVLQDRLHQGSTLSDQKMLPLTNSPLQQLGEPASQSVNTGLPVYQEYFNSYQNDQHSPISPANAAQSERRMPSLGQISEHNLQANMISDRRFIPSVPAGGDLTSRGVCKCPDCPQSIYKRSHDVQQTTLSDMQSPRLTTTPHQRGQIFDSNDDYPKSKYITSPPPPYQLPPSMALHPTATPANARNQATLSPTNLGMSASNFRMNPNNLRMNQTNLRMSPNSLRMNPNNLGMSQNTLGMNPDHLRMNQTNLRMSPNSLRMNPNNLGMSQNTLGMNPDNLGMSQTNLRMSPNTVRMSPNTLRMNTTNLPHTSSPSISRPLTNSTISTPVMGMDITNTKTVTNLGMSATNLGMSATNLGTSVTNPRIDMTNTGSILMNNNGMHMPNLVMSPINPIGVPNSQPSPTNPQMRTNSRIGLSNSTMSRPNSIHGWDMTEQEFTEMAAKMTSPESRSWLLEQQRIKRDNALIHNWKASAQHQSRQLPFTPDSQLPNISYELPNQQTPNKTVLMSEQDSDSRMAPILRPSKFPRIQSFNPSKINIYKLQQALMLENKTKVQSNPSLCTTPHQTQANGWNTIDSNQQLKKQPEIPLRAFRADIRPQTELLRDYEHAQPHKTVSLDRNMNIALQDDSPMDLSKK